MKTNHVHFSIRLKTAVEILLLAIPVLGCNGGSTSPCIDCDGRVFDVLEESLPVGEAASITVDNFTGKVTYRTGEPGRVRVVATRRATSQSDLESLEVNVMSYQSDIEVMTENPMNLKQTSVDLEITAPADAMPLVNTAVGEIDYKGRPTGFCRFATGVGSIRLRLPTDVNVALDLSTGVGSIHMRFPVIGEVSSQPSFVRGRIGHGGDGQIEAATAVGSIYVVRW